MIDDEEWRFDFERMYVIWKPPHGRRKAYKLMHLNEAMYMLMESKTHGGKVYKAWKYPPDGDCGKSWYRRYVRWQIDKEFEKALG